MAKEYKLSPERLIELQCEQYYLTTIRGKEVAELLKEARSFGDLSENSEYDEAKNEQGRLHSRIAELDNILSNYILNKISREQLEEMKQTLADLQAEEPPRTFPSEFVVSWDGMDEHNLQSLSNYYLSCLENFVPAISILRRTTANTSAWAPPSPCWTRSSTRRRLIKLWAPRRPTP